MKLHFYKTYVPYLGFTSGIELYNYNRLQDPCKLICIYFVFWKTEYGIQLSILSDSLH